MLTCPVCLKKHTLELSQVCPPQSFSVRSTPKPVCVCVCVCVRARGGRGGGTAVASASLQPLPLGPQGRTTARNSSSRPATIH